MAIQANGPLLDGCVLALLTREDAYGYSLTQQVRQRLGVSESTLYPVMRRLQTDGSLVAYDAPHNGRNRRYYRITPHGAKRSTQINLEWHDFKTKVDAILDTPGGAYSGDTPALRSGGVHTGEAGERSEGHPASGEAAKRVVGAEPLLKSTESGDDNDQA
jgi:PadR family transcriptional regulator PadR